MSNDFVMAAAAAAPQGGLGGMNFMVMIVLFFGLMYVMMIRPQQRREKERQKLIAELRAGQRVMFAGGLIGTIVEAREHTFVVEIAPKVSVEVARGAVARVLKEGEAAKLDEQR